MGSTQFGNFHVSRVQWADGMGPVNWQRVADEIGRRDNRTFVETRLCPSVMCVTLTSHCVSDG